MVHNIPNPKSTKFEKVSENKGNFVIEPLFPGYGITVGNALRRVLFSSIPGAAITAVRIEGVDHEFSSIDYVKEDVVDIVLNIKQINLHIEGSVESDEEEKLTLKLKKTGAGVVTAGDIECPTQIKIANKDQEIATITDSAGSLEMEFTVARGLGYEPIESREKGDNDIGYIAVDAIFTPISNVSMHTEHVRVGEMTNWDKLVLGVETNGTVTCEDAFEMAVSILVEQFNSLINVDDLKKEDVVSESESEEDVVEDDSKEEDESEDEEKKKRGRPKKGE